MNGITDPEDHARVMGWTFTFAVYGVHDHDPKRVIVEGVVKEIMPQLEEDREEGVHFYESEEHALEIAEEAALAWFEGVWQEDEDEVELEWIETLDIEPEHYMGLEQVDEGIWV